MVSVTLAKAAIADSLALTSQAKQVNTFGQSGSFQDLPRNLAAKMGRVVVRWSRAFVNADFGCIALFYGTCHGAWNFVVTMELKIASRQATSIDLSHVAVKKGSEATRQFSFTVVLDIPTL